MPSPQWHFADFCLDPDNVCLWREARPITLTPKAFDVLLYLVTHANHVVTKDTLLDAVWPETAVSDVVVRMAIGELRKILGDMAQAPRFIATVHRRGYRFVAPVTVHTTETPISGSLGQARVPLPPRLEPPLPGVAAGSLPVPLAERRHLTVLFCDLVDAPHLAEHLDPEDYREVVQAYYQTCMQVIAHFDGYVAQYMGDGMLVYFGYPVAHEDDAQRAVRAGLGMLRALPQLVARLPLPPGAQLAVRLGIHTGLVVVGDVGSGPRHERLALGETPNLAARLQTLAAPNTIVISAATRQLLGGFFACQPLGTIPLQGRPQPFAMYQVLAETSARRRLEVGDGIGLPPLVGREPEVALLQERWAQVQDGRGQVVLLSGEAGIGKSRLVQMLQEQVAAASLSYLIPCQCSSYYQHSALHPLIELLERLVVRGDHEASPVQKLGALEEFVEQHGLSLPHTVPLLAALLALPLPASYAPRDLAPAQQKQQTLYALLTILLHHAAQQPVLLVMEDLHWVDPSTLELLSLLVDQGPTARILTLLTFRPDFIPPWTGRSHCTHVMLQRLPHPQVVAMIERIAQGKSLPPEVVEQIVTKTDGVPLFVEELTKMVLESDLLHEQEECYELTGPVPPLAIPATLHDSLVARLDRLTAAKGLAQLGATLGREFAYELLLAVSPWDEETVQQGLQQLVAAELLYQQGLPPQATYHFKHALIQEAAYQSLLKRTRQQYHQHAAQVLETQFVDVATRQPELLAHHYTEAGLTVQAVQYWQRAGENALQRSANLEAVQHLSKGLQVLQGLPETLARQHQELALQMHLGPALMAAKGPAAPEMAQTYARARALCQQIGDTPELFPALRGLCLFYRNRGVLLTAQELGVQICQLAQRAGTLALLLEAQEALGGILFYLGDYTTARLHLEQGIAHTNPTTQRAQALRQGVAPGVTCLTVTALALWCLGYPAQAIQRSQEAHALALTLVHPHSVATAQHFAALLYHRCRQIATVQAHVETLQPLATAQGFPLWMGYSTFWQGWLRAMQHRDTTGLTQMQQGMMAVLSTGQTLSQPFCLLLLAEATAHTGRIDEGLRLLAEALTSMQKSKRGDLLAETYRLRGELLLRHAVPDVAQAEACFQQSLTIAHDQQAKAWELRTATSLSRLWQQQGKCAEARALLAPLYGWFSEGFDTPDLQDARALLDSL